MPETETCSWCVTEVNAKTLKETDDGALICRECWKEYKASGR